MSGTPKGLLTDMLNESDRLYARLSGGHGVEIGAAGFDDAVVAHSLDVVCNVLQRGDTIADARKEAVREVCALIRKHNAKRPTDINWQRSNDAEQYMYRVDAYIARITDKVC